MHVQHRKTELTDIYRVYISKGNGSQCCDFSISPNKRPLLLFSGHQYKVNNKIKQHYTFLSLIINFFRENSVLINIINIKNNVFYYILQWIDAFSWIIRLSNSTTTEMQPITSSWVTVEKGFGALVSVAWSSPHDSAMTDLLWEGKDLPLALLLRMNWPPRLHWDYPVE